MCTSLSFCFKQQFEAWSFISGLLWKVLIQRTSCTNFLLQVSSCVHPYSLLYKTFKPWFWFTALQDHFLHKSLGGANTGDPQEKPPGLTRNQKLVYFHTGPEHCPTRSGELTEWLRDRIALYTWRLAELYCFIQLILLCVQKSYTNQKL